LRRAAAQRSDHNSSEADAFLLRATLDVASLGKPLLLLWSCLSAALRADS